MGSLARRGHHGNGPTSEGAIGAERANTMIGLQIMMPAGSWPPVPVRASSRHIRSWGDSGHAGHIGGTAALHPQRTWQKSPNGRYGACIERRKSHLAGISMISFFRMASAKLS